MGNKEEGMEDQIIGSIGEWGRWQAKWFLVLCCVALPSGFPRYIHIQGLVTDQM